MTGTYQITFTSLLALIDEIAGRQIYDYIIAEFPEGLTSEMQMRLFSSETILITCMQNKDSAERINSFAEVMKTLSGQLYITCGRCEVNKENHINDVVHNLGFPVCEYVPQLDKYSIEALLERGCYKNTAAAIS